MRLPFAHVERMMGRATLAVPAERIERAILLIRGHKVMLDADLADLYGVETRVLNQAVKRNAGRFPPDFMFQLRQDELGQLVGSLGLRSQIGISKPGRGGRRYLPLAFTEQGVAMLSNALRSERAEKAEVVANCDHLQSLRFSPALPYALGAGENNVWSRTPSKPFAPGTEACRHP